MKSKLFVEAAHLVFNDVTQFSCNAIGYANAARLGKSNDYIHSDEVTFYTNLFQIPEFSTFGGMFFTSFGSWTTDNKLKEIRVLALLLAAQVAKTEKKSFSKSKFGAKFKK